MCVCVCAPTECGYCWCCCVPAPVTLEKEALAPRKKDVGGEWEDGKRERIVPVSSPCGCAGVLLCVVLYDTDTTLPMLACDATGKRALASPLSCPGVACVLLCNTDTTLPKLAKLALAPSGVVGMGDGEWEEEEKGASSLDTGCCAPLWPSCWRPACSVRDTALWTCVWPGCGPTPCGVLRGVLGYGGRLDGGGECGLWATLPTPLVVPVSHGKVH